MELELRIIRDPYAKLGRQATRVFGETGGSVGRAPDNYWVLPDPELHLSGHHCVIQFRDGAFWVHDTSRNGVFLNDTERPLGFGSKARLSNGDVIYLATYAVQAKVRRRGERASVAARAEVVEEPLIAAEELFVPTASASASNEPRQHLEHVAAESAPSPNSLPDSKSDAAEVAEVIEVAEVEEAIEVAEVAEVVEAAEVAEVTEVSNVAEVAEVAEVIEVAEIEQVPEEVEIPAIHENRDEIPAQLHQAADTVESTAEHQQLNEQDDLTEATDVDAPEEIEVTSSTVHPDEQPAELLATRVLDPAFVAAELKRVIHIDRARLQAGGHLPPQKIERLVANQFRHLKRPLIKNAFGKGAEPVTNGHLVMMTSSLPAEGKTFSSINLALSLAREKDLEVVLVDADVAKQHLSLIFGITQAPGLLNALADDTIDVESLILPTDIKGLSLLSSGQCAEDDIATELLASSRMEAVAARIGGPASKRIVLFDSPPILLTNESRVLASLLGQILLVVRAGVTPRPAVLEAIGYLDKQKPLGLVLNQAKSHAPGSYYGYGAYGYGAYGDDADGKASKKAGHPQG